MHDAKDIGAPWERSSPNDKLVYESFANLCLPRSDNHYESLIWCRQATYEANDRLMMEREELLSSDSSEIIARTQAAWSWAQRR